MTFRGPRGDVATLPFTHESTYAESIVTGFAIRSGYNLAVFPQGALAAVKVVSDCVRVSSAEASETSAPPKVNASAPTFTTPIADAIRTLSCGQTEVQVTGSFVLVLWQWDAIIETGGMSSTLPSGLEASGLPSPVSAAAYPSLAKARQRYLYANDAVLSIPLVDISPHALYLAEGHLAVQGVALLDNATGNLRSGAVDHPIANRELELVGNVEFSDLQSTGVGSPVHARVAGAIESANSDGAALGLATVQPSTGSPLPWLLGALGAVLVAAPAILVPLGFKRRSDARFADDLTGMAYDAVCLQDYAKVRSLASKVIQVDDEAGEAHLLVGVAESHLGDLASALASHQRARALLAHEPGLAAENAYFAALACARHRQSATGERREELRLLAVKWFGEAVSFNPDYACDLAIHPELGDCFQPQDGTVPYWLRP